MVQSARHNSYPKNHGLNISTETDQKDQKNSESNLFRRSKSFSAEVMDVNDIGSHHILELPSLLEPKGLISVSLLIIIMQIRFIFYNYKYINYTFVYWYTVY